MLLGEVRPAFIVSLSNGFLKSLCGRFAKTVSSAVSSLVIVINHPFIQVLL